MTIINPNSIAGITSVTAEAGVMNFYKSDGTLAGLQLNGVNFNTTAGVSTFNNLYVGGVLTYEDVKNVDSVGIITARTGIAIPNDTYKLRSGTDLEMQVWHDGTNSIIKDTRNSGKVRIQADNFDIIDKDASETMLSATVDGAVSLNYNGSTKLATTNTGVSITGIPVATQSTGNVGLELHATGSGRGSQTKYHNDHGEAYIGQAGDTTGELLIHNTTASTINIATGNANRIKISGTSAATSIGGAMTFNAMLTTQGDVSGGLLMLKAAENTNRFFVSGSDSNGVEVNLYDGAGGQKGILGVSTGEFFIKAPNSSAPMNFYTHNGSSVGLRLKINSAGDILLGTDQATIGCNTADGSDNRSFNLCGGSDASQNRGAVITIYGNEANNGSSQYGVLSLKSGNTSTGHVEFYTQGAERLRIASDGKLMTQAAGYIYTASSAGSLTLAGGNTNLGGKIVLTGGNGTGDINFYAQQSTATPAERMRIMSDGRTGINTSDPRFNNSNSAASNYFYQNDPKFGVHGSITIGNLSSTAADKRELAFYRRGGPTPGTSISNHHMGRVAWYGSSNDSAFPDMAWSLDCTANGGGWTAGSNRHGYLSFVSGRSGELIRIRHDAKVSIGFAGAPTSRVHIKGNSANGADDATVTIDDIDTTANSKEPILAFDGGGTRQARIMSSDQTSTGAGGLYFGVGSSNTTALQLTAQRYTKIHNDTRDWATVEYKNLRTHCRMHYSPGNAVQTYTILRIRRHWWGWGHYKIRCKAIYYNSSLESTWFVNGHGSGGNNYSIANETYGGDASNQTWGCTVTHTASNNSPGSSGTWYADIKVNIPNYYYVTIWVEAWGSSYTTDPTTGVANSINTYCLM